MAAQEPMADRLLVVALVGPEANKLALLVLVAGACSLELLH